MAGATKTGGGTVLFIIIVAVVVAALLARAPRGGSDRKTDEPRYDIHLAVVAAGRYKGDPDSIIRIEIWINDQPTYNSEWGTRDWKKTLKLPSGTKIELKVYYVYAVIVAECTIFDDNGYVYDTKAEVYGSGQNIKPAVCLASVV